MVRIPFKDAYNLVDKTNLERFWYDHISIWARLTWNPDVATKFKGTATRILGSPSVLVLSNAAKMAY